MKDEWNSLLERSITNEIFLSWEWIYSWWNVFKDKNKKLFILIANNSDNKVVGIAPFYIETINYFILVKRNIVRFCSSLETYPDHLDFISDYEHEHSFLEMVFKYLKENDKVWDVIELNSVKENSMIIKYITFPDRHVNRGLIVNCIPESKCPYLIIENSFEEYLKSLSRKKRYNLLKEQKKLFETEKVIFNFVDNSKNVEKYLRQLFDLHVERAKQKRIKTTFYGDNIYNFHKTFIDLLFNKNKIIITFLLKDSKPLCSSYCIKHNNKYYYYQSGLSIEGEKKGAGSVLLFLIIKKAFEENCYEFDFLRGNEAYKCHWSKLFRQNYSIIIRKNNCVGKLFSKTNFLRCKLKALKYLYYAISKHIDK